MAYPAFHPDDRDDRRDGTVRLWISQQQWMAVLEGTERLARERESDGQQTPLVNRRENPRLPAPEDARCLLRLAENASHHGTFMVKLRDVSDAGLGFYSAQPFDANTRCTVALQDLYGNGMVCSANIVWCKQVDEDLFDVGVRFDKPIDPLRFASPGEDAAGPA